MAHQLRHPVEIVSRLIVRHFMLTLNVNIHCAPDRLNSTTDLWDQNLYINDELVSHVSTSKGQHGNIFYVSVECAAQPCTTVPAHSMYTLFTQY